MVWIHGGGYMLGSGDRNIYGPDFLVDEHVVVVTFNYRLGVLGKYYSLITFQSDVKLGCNWTIVCSYYLLLDTFSWTLVHCFDYCAAMVNLFCPASVNLL
jgi:hypothetical protein